MAFVSRAPRALKNYDETGTTPNLGPGAYIKHDYKPQEHGYAPFSSTTQRSSALMTGTNYTPAPGEYEKTVKWAASSVGESAFKSRVERLKGVENPSIAPGCVSVRA